MKKGRNIIIIIVEFRDGKGIMKFFDGNKYV
jgi:hypothetical protein